MTSLLVTLLLLAAILAVFGTLAYGAISAAPWVPMPTRDVERLLNLANLKPDELIYDLGCGDGRLIVSAAERYKVRAVGYELALLPFCFAWLRKIISPARSRISIRYENFWKVDLSQVDVVVCFLTPYAMRKLESKIAHELIKTGSRLLSYSFRLHSRTPSLVNKEKQSDAPIYVYT